MGHQQSTWQLLAHICTHRKSAGGDGQVRAASNSFVALPNELHEMMRPLSSLGIVPVPKELLFWPLFHQLSGLLVAPHRDQIPSPQFNHRHPFSNERMGCSHNARPSLELPSATLCTAGSDTRLSELSFIECSIVQLGSCLPQLIVIVCH